LLAPLATQVALAVSFGRVPKATNEYGHWMLLMTAEAVKVVVIAYASALSQLLEQ
jgi:hypothetical protein